MKKIVLVLAVILALTACNSKKSTAPVTKEDENNEVSYTIVKNYFFKSDLDKLPPDAKIVSEETFGSLFGMATTMGEGGKPTEIDFANQIVLAIVLPTTNYATEINPVKLEVQGDSLLYTFEIKKGEKQSFSIQPISIIAIDKKYENKEVTLVTDKEITYFPAIDRYLVNEFGKQYLEGEHCVPFHSIVAVDERKAEDILVWGDYWVFNYNQVGDTLKCVSGGSHPGLMHIRQTDYGFEVTDFDQVEDGSRNLQSAKRIFGDKYDAFHAINSDADRRERLRADVLAEYVRKQGLSATMYQDYGWPAKKLPK